MAVVVVEPPAAGVSQEVVPVDEADPEAVSEEVAVEVAAAAEASRVAAAVVVASAVEGEVTERVMPQLERPVTPMSRILKLLRF